MPVKRDKYGRFMKGNIFPNKIKDKMSESHKKNWKEGKEKINSGNFKKGDTSWNKGKVLGPQSEELIKRKSEKMIKWHKEIGLSKEQRRKIGLKHKGKIFRCKNPEERIKKIRLTTINNIKNTTGLAVNIGKNEKQLLDEFEKSNNLKLRRQYPISGYFVDGYCKKLNIVVEIDESFHENRKQKDTTRQKNIMKELNCNFIRIKDY